MDLIYKGVSDSVLDVDDKSRRVKVAISEVGSRDLDNEIIEPGAYTKTISERGPGGANLIWHLTDHYPSLKYAVGKFASLNMEGNKLIGATDIPKTTWGNDMLEMYKSGVINQHSVGFSTLRSEIMNQGEKDQYRVLKELKLYEGSAVLWGANPNTPTMSVGKSEGERKTALDKILKELEVLRKCFKNGTLTDDTFELIEVRILQLETSIKSLFEATHAVQNSTPVPVNIDAAKLFLLIQN
jgi:HK97 family phage prohead protease